MNVSHPPQHMHIEFENEPQEFKKTKIIHTKLVANDKTLIEFPLENGKTRLDYCPARCSICLMGILKEEAKAGPCVSHVFHKDCIEKWAIYCVDMNKAISCPNCLTQYKNIDPLYE